jgi:hypothetical protein
MQDGMTSVVPLCRVTMFAGAAGESKLTEAHQAGRKKLKVSALAAICT